MLRKYEHGNRSLLYRTVLVLADSSTSTSFLWTFYKFTKTNEKNDILKAKKFTDVQINFQS